MKYTVAEFLLITVLVLSGCVTTSSPKTTYLFEGFEEEGKILAVGDSWGDGDQSLDVSLTQEWKSQGDSAASCRFFLSSNTALGATFNLEGFTKANWQGYNSLQLDILNTSDSQIQVSMALSTGDSWYWQETPVVSLEPGLNQNVSFSFNEVYYKSQGTNWNNTGELEGLKKVMRLAFKFFGPEMDEVTVILDNIQLLP